MSKILYIRMGEKLDVAQIYIRIEDDLLEALLPLSSAEGLRRYGSSAAIIMQTRNMLPKLPSNWQMS